MAPYILPQHLQCNHEVNSFLFIQQPFFEFWHSISVTKPKLWLLPHLALQKDIFQNLYFLGKDSCDHYLWNVTLGICVALLGVVLWQLPWCVIFAEFYNFLLFMSAQQSFQKLRTWGRTSAHFFLRICAFFLYFWMQNRKNKPFFMILAQFDKILKKCALIVQFKNLAAQKNLLLEGLVPRYLWVPKTCQKFACTGNVIAHHP